MRTLLACVLAGLLSFTPNASATTTFDDGGVHVVNGPADDLVVTAATTVVLDVAANVFAPYPQIGVTGDAGSTLRVEGGNVFGAAFSNLVGLNAVEWFDGTFEMHGGQLRGGDGFQTIGGHGLRAFDSNVTMTDGLVREESRRGPGCSSGSASS